MWAWRVRGAARGLRERAVAWCRAHAGDQGAMGPGLLQGGACDRSADGDEVGVFGPKKSGGSCHRT